VFPEAVCFRDDAIEGPERKQATVGLAGIHPVDGGK
jgi:hypothetical protein